MSESLWNEGCLFSPSLITLDHANFEQQIHTLEKSGAKMIHVDILDGHFSPSMPLGLDTLRRIREITDLPFDVHLMTITQDYFVDELLDIGVSQLVFHLETEAHPDHLLTKIKDHGVRAGIALKPSTQITDLEYVLERCDCILLMLINPGYAGSKSEQQVPYADRKVRELRKMINERGLDTKISIDGRISIDNIRAYGQEIVDIFVCGSTVLNMNNLSDSFARLNNIRSQLLGLA